MDIEQEMCILAASIRATIEEKKNTVNPVNKVIDKALSDLDLTLISVVVDPAGSSLLSWGVNDDPAPGTLEKLVSDVYKVSGTFKHRQLFLGILNELKEHKLYVGINYTQRTLFIARI